MILSSFLISVQVSNFELVDEFTKIFTSAFGHFIDHHQGLLACITSVFERVFQGGFLITLQNYVHAEWDKTEMLRYLKIERYQQK